MTEPEVSLSSPIEDQFMEYMAMKITFGNKSSLKKNIESIQFWQVHSHRFPLLAELAFSMLAIQGSSGASERMFSSGGWHTAGRKNCLKNENLSNKVFLSQNKNIIRPHLFKDM